MQRRRGSRADPVSEDDILRAIAKLGVLGGGFAVVKVGERRLVRSLRRASRHAEQFGTRDDCTPFSHAGLADDQAHHHFFPFSSTSIPGLMP